MNRELSALLVHSNEKRSISSAEFCQLDHRAQDLFIDRLDKEDPTLPDDPNEY